MESTSVKNEGGLGTRILTLGCPLKDPRYVAQYTPNQRQVLKFRPGVTSAASLAYRREEQMLGSLNWEKVYQKEVLPAKLAIDLDYFSKRTLLSDLLLIVRTIFSLFR